MPNPTSSLRFPWRLILAGLVLAGLLVWLIKWPAGKKHSASSQSWAGFNRRQAVRIEVNRPGHPAVVLEKQHGAWWLTQPYAAPADQSTVKNLLGELSRIVPDRKLGAAGNLAAYGLDHPPSLVVHLAGGRSLQFEFGNPAPTGEGDYMKLASAPEVVLAPDYVKADSLHGAFNFEDKTLLHFTSNDVTALAIVNHGRRARFQRVKGQWPSAQASDISDLLDSLQNAAMNSIADQSGKDPARYGLASPAIRVRLSWKGGGGTLDVGKKTKTGDYYARSSARPAIVTISSYLLDDLRKLAKAPAKAKPAHRPPHAAAHP